MSLASPSSSMGLVRRHPRVFSVQQTQSSHQESQTSDAVEMNEMSQSQLGFSPSFVEQDVEERKQESQALIEPTALNLNQLCNLPVTQKLDFLHSQLSLASKLQFLRGLDNYDLSWRHSSFRKLCGGKSSESSTKLVEMLSQIQDPVLYAMDISKPNTCHFTQNQENEINDCWQAVRDYMADPSNGPNRGEGKKARALYRQIDKRCQDYFEPEEFLIMRRKDAKFVGGVGIGSAAMTGSSAALSALFFPPALIPIAVIGVAKVTGVVATAQGAVVGSRFMREGQTVSEFEIDVAAQDIQRLNTQPYETLKSFVESIVNEYKAQVKAGFMPFPSKLSRQLVSELEAFLKQGARLNKEHLVRKLIHYISNKDECRNTHNNGKRLFLIIKDNLDKINEGVPQRQVAVSAQELETPNLRELEVEYADVSEDNIT